MSGIQQNNREFPFQVIVRLNNRVIEPEDDGYLGKFTRGEFEIHVFVPYDYPNKVVVFKKDPETRELKQTPDKLFACQQKYNYILNEPAYIYEKKCKVRYRELAGDYVVYHPRNVLVFIERVGDGFIFWEVSVIAQNGLFFLATQCKYAETCYRDEDGMVVCPNRNSVEIQTILNQVFSPDDMLSCLDTYRRSEDISLNLEENQARVIFYDKAWQFGLVQAGDAVASVAGFSSDPRPGQRLAYFEAGEIIEFVELESTAKGFNTVGARPLSA